MPDMNVNYGDLQTVAGRLRAGEAHLDAELGDLKSLVEHLVSDGFVTDAASDAFQAAFEEFSRGATQVIAGLTQMSGYLDVVASTFQDADQQLARALRR